MNAHPLPRFCVNCRNSEQVTASVYRCGHSKAAGPIDLVTGSQAPNDFCSVMRCDGQPCGREAVLFEQRQQVAA